MTRFKSSLRQIPIFKLLLRMYRSPTRPIMSTLTVHCWWQEKTVQCILWNCLIVDQVEHFLTLFHCECSWLHIQSASPNLWCSFSQSPSVRSLHIPTKNSSRIRARVHGFQLPTKDARNFISPIQGPILTVLTA